ncbi:uncharacterized protein LOC116289014 [Actinia tenebrosa]|uniref:Uncharacterized protein LOC116289014 n=1 Tax=Actinia tenebrosa TaxID=6105 RepID=A0A6P8H5U1_ACTTE|nr:uncharacterized protein LOC116289014 [Actinia tenebrosa]
MAEISFNNAHRSGVIANMQLTEFERGQKEQDQIVVDVFEHKTVHIHGPAQVVFDPTLHSWVNIFLRNVSSCLPNAANASQLFLSWNGEKMTSGQITMCVKSVWKKAGLEGVVSATAMRKAAVTVTCDNKEAGMSSDEILSTKKQEKETAAVTSMETSIDTHDSSGKKVETNDDEHRPFRFSNKELKEIRKIFQAEIIAKSISMDDVRNKIEKNEILEGLRPRRVYDRVRSEWRSKTQLDDSCACVPLEIETIRDKMERIDGTDDDQDEAASAFSVSVVYPTTEASQGHGIFSTGEIFIIQKACRDIIAFGPISKIRISNHLEKTESGKIMLEKFTSEQLLNRVKYERRMKRRQTK